MRQGLVAACTAATAAERRQAVWGEGGWPYGDAVRSADVVEGVKKAIAQQREDGTRAVGRCCRSVGWLLVCWGARFKVLRGA